MTTMAKVLTLAAALLAANCTTVNTEMRSWLGRDIDAAITEKGAPTGTADLADGQRAYTWAFEHDGDTCRTTFVTDPQGSIVAYSFQTCPGRGSDSGSGHL